MARTIGNPLSWTARTLFGAGRYVGSAASSIGGDASAPIVIRDITVDDIRAALRSGAEDFAAFRSDVIALCVVYPLAGLTLAWFAFDRELLPLVFPLVSGFAIVGPLAGVGLYELSRRREKGMPAGWGDVFAPLSSPALSQILVLGIYLFGLFVGWMVCANWIYRLTLGPEAPVSLGQFVSDVLTTPAGWAMMVIGVAVGGVFAAAALAISIVSFPLVLDRGVGVPAAVSASIAVARRNPRTVAIWGLIVAVSLTLGALPALVGLAFVLPLLGHATWHLYRRAIEPLPA